MNKIGRNAPCPCGSGLKYKRCCEEKDAFDELVKSTDFHDKLQVTLSHAIYKSVLKGVWNHLGPVDNDNPPIEELEIFFELIYGRQLDRNDLDRIVLPLPLEPITELLNLGPEDDRDGQPDLFLPDKPEPPQP